MLSTIHQVLLCQLLVHVSFVQPSNSSHATQVASEEMKRNALNKYLHGSNDLYINHGDEIMLYNVKFQNGLYWQRGNGLPLFDRGYRPIQTTKYQFNDSAVLIDRLIDDELACKDESFVTYIIERDDGKPGRINHGDTMQLYVKPQFAPKPYSRPVPDILRAGDFYHEAAKYFRSPKSPNDPCFYDTEHQPGGFVVLTDNGKPLTHNSIFEFKDANHNFPNQRIVARSNKKGHYGDLDSDIPDGINHKWKVFVTGNTLNAVAIELEREENARAKLILGLTIAGVIVSLVVIGVLLWYFEKCTCLYVCKKTPIGVMKPKYVSKINIPSWVKQ